MFRHLASLVTAAVAMLVVRPGRWLGRYWVASRAFGLTSVWFSNDVATYFRAADAVMAGRVPYRDFVLEYPRAALPLFILPRLFTTATAVYTWLSAVQVLVLDSYRPADWPGTQGRCSTEAMLTAVTPEEFAGLARALREKVQRVFKRRGWLARDEVNNEGERLDALMMCGRGAHQPGVRERAGPALAHVDELEVEQSRGGLVTNVDGLNLYASPVIDGNDRERLEHLCRYLLLPASRPAGAHPAQPAR